MNKFVTAIAIALFLAVPAEAQHKTATSSDGKVVYISKTPGDTASISTYYNRNVYNRAGEKLGDVNDLLLGSDGKLSTVVIGVGGFLGIGEKEVAVPFSALQVTHKDNSWYLVMDATKDTLKSAPAFEHVGDRVPMNVPVSTPPTPPKQ